MIDLIRLDERLIHGQIAASWCKSLTCDTLLVIDNAAAQDQFITKTLYMAAPTNMKTFVMTDEDALKVLCDPRAENRHIFVVMRHIDEFLYIISKAPNIKEINVANYGKMIPSTSARKTYSSNLFLNDEEYKQLKRVLDIGIPCYMQMTPVVEKKKLSDILASATMSN